MSRFGIYPASFNSGGFLLNNIRSVRPNGGAQKLLARAGGSLTRSIVGTAFADPRVTFQSADLAQALTNVSMLAGAAITSTSLIQYQRRVDQAAFSAGSDHITLSVAKGFLMPTGITAQADDTEPAVIDLELICQYDGTNIPLQFLTGQALTGSPAVTEVYYLSKVFLEGSQIPGHLSTTITPGLNYSVLRSDGDIWPREGSLSSIGQEIRLTGTYVEQLASLGFNGSAASSGLTVYLQKGIHGGARTSAATAAHISVTMAAGDYDVVEVPVEGTNDAQPVLVCRPIGNLAISTTATIP